MDCNIELSELSAQQWHLRLSVL